MEQLEATFNERLSEIESYLLFLENLDREAQQGPPRIGENGEVITVLQQRILYSGVFLQLYNLVEATVVDCLESVTEKALKSKSPSPIDLTEHIRREWVRVIGRTHIDLNYENRLVSALTLFSQLVDSLPVNGFKMDRGGGGNWDDKEIETLALRLGLDLQVTPNTYSLIKRKFKDDLGPLTFVKKFRNSLAHGAISFAQCSENISVIELRQLSNLTSTYLREVVHAFTRFVSTCEYLIPSKRPIAEV